MHTLLFLFGYRPAYLFLLRIPLDVMHECLRFRLEHKPAVDPSAHSIQQVGYQAGYILLRPVRTTVPSISAPQSKNAVCVFYTVDHTQSASFCLGKFLKKFADDQCSSITKGSMYYIKHMYVQPFSMEVD